MSNSKAATEQVEELKMRLALAAADSMGGVAFAALAVDELEQAISATLGSDDEYEAKMDELLCRLTNGKWSKSRAYDIDFMESCINEEFENLYAKELADATLGSGTLTAEQVRETVLKRGNVMGPRFYGDWQAIADELNAEVGGTCENVSCPPSGFLCSECGWGDFAEPSHLLTTAKFTGRDKGPNFCPNCGKAAER